MNLKTKVIFISGFQEFEYAKAAVTYGAVDYLLKPVIREKLINAIEKCMAEFGSARETLEEEPEEKGDYERLIQLEDTGYTPVYVEILQKSGSGEQMKKLVQFSFISLLEE